MRKLLLTLLMTLPLAAQTVNPNQIRPSATSGDVLTTVTGGQPPVWHAPSGSGISIQHNGTAVPVQNILNFNDTVPNAPPGFSNVTFLNDGTGKLSAFYSPGAGLTPLVQGPISGQFAIIYPTTGVINNLQLYAPIYTDIPYINPTSAFLPYSCPNTLCSPGATDATWSGFSLPSYIPAANVTAVYAFSVASATAYGPMVNPQIVCTGGNIVIKYGWPLLQYTSPALSGITGSNIGTISCTSHQGGSLFGNKASALQVTDIGLLVYYTGTAPPADPRIKVVPPLGFNISSNELFIDPFALGHLNPYTIAGAYGTTLPNPVTSLNQEFLVTDAQNVNDCTTGGGTTKTKCISNGTTYVADTGSSGVTLQTNTVNNTSQTTLNVINSTVNTTGLTATASNPSAGNVKYEIAGTLSMTSLAGFASPTAGDVAVWSGSNWTKFSGNTSGTQCFTETSSGVPGWGTCGSGGSGSWSSLTNPTGNLALTMGADTSTFTFNSTTGSSDLFKLTDGASNTGTGIMFHATTASASTEIPFQADANGVGWKVATDGTLTGVGSSSSHGLKITEGTALSGVSSVDVLTTSSTSHRILENPNNAGAVILSGIASAGTSGHLAKLASNGIDIVDGGLLPWSCQPGQGDGLNAVTAGTYLQTTCYNDTGQTVTLTGIKCFTDNNGTSTMNVTNGSGTGLLTGSITCTTSFAAGTQSGTTTIASGDFLKFTFVADGTSKQSTWVVTGTRP